MSDTPNSNSAILSQATQDASEAPCRPLLELLHDVGETMVHFGGSVPFAQPHSDTASYADGRLITGESMAFGALSPIQSDSPVRVPEATVVAYGDAHSSWMPVDETYPLPTSWESLRHPSEAAQWLFEHWDLYQAPPLFTLPVYPPSSAYSASTFSLTEYPLQQINASVLEQVLYRAENQDHDFEAHAVIFETEGAYGERRLGFDFKEAVDASQKKLPLQSLADACHRPFEEAGGVSAVAEKVSYRLEVSKIFRGVSSIADNPVYIV
ncbi:hypothetical protein EIP86_009184 [Pleurotus ostreatoroseus]|nr:hypothetical protein EIP86_009184 [Pleurotus ostreatoroseus]